MFERILTTREVADEISNNPVTQGMILEWQVRRLYEDANLPEPSRFAGKRAIPADQIPAIVAALRERGWLPAATETTAKS